MLKYIKKWRITSNMDKPAAEMETEILQVFMRIRIGILCISDGIRFFTDLLKRILFFLKEYLGSGCYTCWLQG